MRLAVDANTLVRCAGNAIGLAFIGNPTLDLSIAAYTLGEAEEHFTRRLRARSIRTGMSSAREVVVLTGALAVMRRVTKAQPLTAYADFEDEARERLPDDPDDWHTVALALAEGRDILTDDRHFFGYGVAVWTFRTLSIRITAGRI